jgi:cell wall-associated NlpC family hydrolase
MVWLAIGVFFLAHGSYAVALQTGSPDLSTLQEGDVIFQKSHSTQSLAIQLATGSVYTHCGILLHHNKSLQVLEAADTVRWTPLAEWIRRGIDGHYVVMRLKKNMALSPAVVGSMRASSKYYIGRPYDLLFQWSDDKIYCSELVWKLYQRSAGIELGRLRSFYD